MTEGNEKKTMIDEGFQSQALDRAYLFAKIIEENLLAEEFVQMVPDIKDMVEKAVELLNDAYMRIGGFQLENGVWIDWNKPK